MTSWLSKTTLKKLLDLAGLHCTISERSGPSLHSMQHKFLSRPLSFLDWTTAMLFWLDFHHAQSNLYRRFRMQWQDWSSTSPKGPMSLHWLPVAAHIKFKTLMLGHPPTSNPLWQSTSPQEIWDLQASDASWCHHREAQNYSPEHFHSPFLAGGMIFPPPSGMLKPWQFSSDTWKLFSSIITWLHHEKNKLNFNFALFPLTSPCLASICSELCLELCITSTSCVRLPLYNVTLIAFLNCKSLWIKASAKLINVNGGNQTV